jgi:hypothetical protein
MADLSEAPILLAKAFLHGEINRSNTFKDADSMRTCPNIPVDQLHRMIKRYEGQFLTLAKSGREEVEVRPLFLVAKQT